MNLTVGDAIILFVVNTAKTETFKKHGVLVCSHVTRYPVRIADQNRSSRTCAVGSVPGSVF